MLFEAPQRTDCFVGFLAILALLLAMKPLLSHLSPVLDTWSFSERSQCSSADPACLPAVPRQGVIAKPGAACSSVRRLPPPCSTDGKHLFSPAKGQPEVALVQSTGRFAGTHKRLQGGVQFPTGGRCRSAIAVLHEPASAPARAVHVRMPGRRSADPVRYRSRRS